MGADLYRDGITEITAAAKPAFDAAVERRNRLLDDAGKAMGMETLNTRKRRAFDHGDPFDHALIYEGYLEAIDACHEVDRRWEAMYPETHYFRDSYNDRSLFWKMGLSWWNDVEELLPDDSSHADPAILQRFLALVIAHKPHLERAVTQLPRDEIQYFLGKYNRLVTFLQSCISAGDGVIFSI